MLGQTATSTITRVSPSKATATFWMAVLLLTTAAYPQSSTPEFPDPGNPHMSRDQQRALGLKAAAQVYEQMPVLPDSSPETQYIRRLGQKLVATIPAENSWPFDFHVVAQKDINAFALPGGPMFVNIGTITAAADEAQLAGVMAHEMSHVYMQHSAKQAAKAQTTGLLAGLAGAVLGATVGGTAQELGQAGIQMGAQGLMLKYSRTDESQADAVGAVILYRAGYNPQALADFFKTLESQGGAPPQILSDHPNPGNRQEAIQREIRNWPPKQYAGDSTEFQVTRKHAMGVKAYTGEEIAQGAKAGQWSAFNKKNGATFNPTNAPLTGAGASSTSAAPPTPPAPTVSLESVLPSQRMVATDLGPLKLQHPENWEVMMPKQQGQSVTIAPKAGVAANGVGYGVVLNGVASSNGQPTNIDDTTRRLMQEMEQNNALQPAGDPQPIIVAGVQGRSVAMHSVSPFSVNGKPDKERDWLVTIPQPDGSVIFMVFVAPQSHYDRFQPTFEAMLKSVRFQQ